MKPQRWNREDQPTIYASHEPEVAAAEKLLVLATSTTLRTARTFWSAAPAIDDLLILVFDPTVFRRNLVDLSGMPGIGDFLTPDHVASQELAVVLLANGPITAVMTPSAVYWPEVRLNEAYFVTLAGQPQIADFPPVAEHRWFKGSP